MEALSTLPDLDKAARYHNFIAGSLADPARTYLESLMQQMPFSYSSPWTDSIRAENTAKAIITVLAARSILVTQPARERILASTDLEELDRWLVRAATIAHVEQLFVD
ncbi:hypothetical protein [Actinocorallia sp. A-T 12471]|uniref:hypothetical protein n=1 Tax=Actinocorallia sp. A-T 12471 TaxID=3089813 RepID=UPI0029CB5319|nr:hypothetical protein [Actinocorallia sp. A-T 12471]MDX6743344.1 hypothetical protein [Actinocorallia sp. A-T 12471]